MKTNGFSLDSYCYLIFEKFVFDELGQHIPEPKETFCYCCTLPVSSREYWNASQIGIKTQKALAVDSESYNRETKVKFEGITYSVSRIYERGDGFTELYLTEKAGLK